MPESSDDILQAMRQAGLEFARIADTIEGKMPKIIAEFKRLPSKLAPLRKELERLAARAASVRLDKLVNDLGDAESGAIKFLATLGNVEKKIGLVASAGQKAAEAMDFGAPAAAATRAVGDLTRQVSQLGTKLAARTEEFKSMEKSADRVSRMDLSASVAGPAPFGARPAMELPDNRDASMLRNTVEGTSAAAADVRTELGGVSEEMLAAQRAAQALRDRFHDFSADISPVLHHFYGMEEALQAISSLIVTARGDLSMMEAPGMLKWAGAAKGQIDALIKASQDFPGLEPIAASGLEKLREAVGSMEDGTKTAGEMREVMQSVGREMEEVKSKGRGLNKALLADVEKLADETKDWYGVSRSNQADMLKWRVKHQKAAERMVERGIRPSVAYAMQLGKAIRDVPIDGLNAEVKQLSSTLKSAVQNVTKMDSFTFTGLVKGALEIQDSFVNLREQMAEMTAQAGYLSGMWSAGLGADQVVGELEALHFSMDNLMDTWGVTKEQAIGASKAMLDAGFSMSSILGPSLKEGEGGILQLAKAGEYAMTGLDELGRLSRLTGRSMSDIAGMAGQWREQMGVMIGEVGETYLELEGHARRSGLAVGKFMDRLMASAGGFVIFGGRMEDISKTLSDLMAGMKLPPGLAEKIAGDYMERLRKTTMEEAMLTTRMLGDKGRDAALVSYKKFVDERGVALQAVERTIKSLESKKAAGEIDDQAYAKLRGEAENRRKSLEKEMDKLNALVAKAGRGDASSLAAIAQHVSRQGHMAGIYTDLLANARKIGGVVSDAVTEAVEAGKKPHEVMRAMTSGLDEMAKSGRGLLHLQNRLTDLGFENEEQFRALVGGQMDRNRMLDQYAGMAGAAGDSIAQLVRHGGSMEDVAAAIEDSVRTPAEMLDRLYDLQAEGFAIPEMVTKKLEEAKEKFIEFEGDPAKQVAAQKEAAMASAKFLAGVVDKPRPAEEDIRDYAKQQTSIQETIKAHLEWMRKWAPLVLTAMAAIKLVISARQAGSLLNLVGGKGGKLGGVGKFFGSGGGLRSFFGKGGGLGKLFGGIAPEGGRLAKTFSTIGAQVGRAGGGLASVGKSAIAAGKSVKGALGGIGKSVLTKVGAVAAPLVQGVFAEMELRSKEQAAYQDAYNRSLEKGKTKAEAREIAGRAKARSVSRGDVGAAVGGVAGAAIGAAAGAWLGPIGMAIGGYIGGKGGAILGGYIGKAFETEANAFNKKMEEIIDLGTLEDAKALVKEEERVRDELRAEKMALIAKDAAGEKLTSDERDKLRELQGKIIERERQIELAKHAEWVKGQEELGEEVKGKMAAEARLRYEALQKKGQLQAKKRRGELSGAEEHDLLTATNLAKATDDVLRKYLASQEMRSLERQKTGIEARAKDVGLSKGDKKDLEGIKKRLEALKSVRFETKEPAKDILQVAGGGVAFLSPGDVVTQAKSLARIVGGGAGQLVRGAAAGPFGDRSGDAARLAALDKVVATKEAKLDLAREIMALKAGGGAVGAAPEGKAATRGLVDNSTWNVFINSRAEKELEQAFLKVLIKHQQRLAN